MSVKGVPPGVPLTDKIRLNVFESFPKVCPTLPPTTRGTTPHGKEPLMVGGKVGEPLNANIDIWALFDKKNVKKNLTKIKKNF